MTPRNILKIKKVISIVLMIFGLVLITQGWFPGEKEMVKNAFEKIEKQLLITQKYKFKPLNFRGFFVLTSCFLLIKRNNYVEIYTKFVISDEEGISLSNSIKIDKLYK